MTHQEIMRLASATYRTLEGLPESDPLKAKAKEKVLEIMEGFAQIQTGRGELFDLSDRRQAVGNLMQSLGVLRNYLSLAKSQGFLDGTALIILDKEYRVLEKELEGMEVLPAVAKLQANNQNQKATASFAEKMAESASQNQQTPRQEKILAFLESHQKAQVADIIKEMPDVTKRTIRRDLDELLKSGKVARFGEFNQTFYRIP